MSVADHEIEQPDPRLCEEHVRRQPCPECAAEHALDEWERRYEQGNTF